MVQVPLPGVEGDPAGEVRAGDVGRPWVGRVSATTHIRGVEGPLLVATIV